MAATLAQRIQDLIGFDYSSNSINSEDEALETACAEVIDLLPDSLLLKYAVAPTPITSSGPDATFASEGKKVIRVIRKDGSSINRVCEEVDIDAFEDMKDTKSIYFPTAYSPIYTIDPGVGTPYLKIRPLINGGLTASVYYITYPKGKISGKDEIEGLPNEVEHAIALKASIYILQTMISDTVQDEEDDEILNMLNNQLQSLAAMYQAEIQRLVGIEEVSK
jgi:hypothetical protein